MRLIFLNLFFLISIIAHAQTVTLSKGVKVNENTDRFLYRVENVSSADEFLGEIEVFGAPQNDAETFKSIYEKAKLVGANAYTIVKTESIEGLQSVFNPSNYRLNLYYRNPADFPANDNSVAVIAHSNNVQSLRINDKKQDLQPRSFIRFDLTNQSNATISTKRFLGSKVVLQFKEGQPEKYFLITGFGVTSDQSDVGGLNIKSGDIIMVEKSYAMYLMGIYRQIELD